MITLAALFAVTALLYGAAGFGGGSTYTALLVLVGTDLAAVPIVSLTCNILVVTVGASRFARAGHIDLRRIWPLFAASVPMAFIGGALPVSRLVFQGMLAAALLVAGLLMLWRPAIDGPPTTYKRWLEPLIGGVLGLVSGIVGIGGGIFLAPALYLLRWGSPRAIAGTCAVFILVNSISGLAGQLQKSGAAALAILEAHWLLFPAVVVGGLIGSALTSSRLDPLYLRILTALLILFVAIRLGIQFIGEASPG